MIEGWVASLIAKTLPIELNIRLRSFLVLLLVVRIPNPRNVKPSLDFKTYISQNPKQTPQAYVEHVLGFFEGSGNSWTSLQIFTSPTQLVSVCVGTQTTSSGPSGVQQLHKAFEPDQQEAPFPEIKNLLLVFVQVDIRVERWVSTDLFSNEQ